MTKSIYQSANGNVENMVAGDMHIHYHKSEINELSEQQRYQMRAELLKYRGVLPEMHNLLCDYASLAFGSAKFVDLEDKQLIKLAQYHQALITLSSQLVKFHQPSEPASGVKGIVRKIICFLERWLSR
ncbi:hypothetical protein ACLQ85_07145 [Gallibacterium anatis]|uniref:hypothetical protein n=1 Tax=Gallibacterium anatis TaxID=750 RepID=UPI0039FC5DA2